jgi:uncharacterized protein (TIGR00299 family) protein
MLKTAPLSECSRELALAVFAEIGRAEAAVHGVDLADVHFHEVGAVDSIVDIVGAALALESLAIDRVVVSPLADGQGTIRCQHGLMPVPVPAVMKMLENTAIPYRTGTCDTELVTPTGMGLAKTLADSYGSLPAMRMLKVGYGFGQREIGRLNALRVVLGESDPEPGAGSVAEIAPAVAPAGIPAGFRELEMDWVVLLSCHLDHATPEQLGYAADCLMAAGALDVSFGPLQMKKWRPGQLLTVIARPEDEYSLVRLIFTETRTIGIRRQVCQRHVCQRSFTPLTLPDGIVRMKQVTWQDVHQVYPEQADLVALAERRQIPLAAAAEIVRAAWQDHARD